MSDQTSTRVRADQTGFYNGSRVRPGTTFTVIGRVPAWCTPVDASEPDQIAEKTAATAAAADAAKPLKFKDVVASKGSRKAAKTAPATDDAAPTGNQDVLG